RFVRALLGRFVLEDPDRLTEALGQRGQFGRSEDEDDDCEDDKGVPAREIVQHDLWPFEWLFCGSGMFSVDVQSPTRQRWVLSTGPRTRRRRRAEFHPPDRPRPPAVLRLLRLRRR